MSLYVELIRKQRNVAQSILILVFRNGLEQRYQMIMPFKRSSRYKKRKTVLRIAVIIAGQK